GVTFAMFGRWHVRRAIDLPVRCLLAAISLLCMFHPSETVSAAVAVPVLLLTVLGIARHRRLGPDAVGAPAAPVADRGEAAALVAEAKREIG
ncbi:MAG: hypothetical protein IT537_17835, partial [Hyphomicrobiales bacterium]|nr:hypothetical protein [Hyphomicrobiales bacterium]